MYTYFILSLPIYTRVYSNILICHKDGPWTNTENLDHTLTIIILFNSIN